MNLEYRCYVNPDPTINLLSGPCALTFYNDDSTNVVNDLDKWIKQYKQEGQFSQKVQKQYEFSSILPQQQSQQVRTHSHILMLQQAKDCKTTKAPPHASEASVSKIGNLQQNILKLLEQNKKLQTKNEQVCMENEKLHEELKFLNNNLENERKEYLKKIETSQSLLRLMTWEHRQNRLNKQI